MKKANIKLVLCAGTLSASATAVFADSDAAAVIAAVYFAGLMVCWHIDQKGDPQ